jgi:hypothetical protein
MRFPTKVVTTAVVAALGAGAGLGLGLAGGDDPPPLWQPATTNAAVPATAAQKEAYAVLGSTQRTEDLDNDAVATLATRSGVGIDADGARVVGATAAGPIWLMPVNGGLCLGLEDTADTSIGVSCEPSGDVIARGMTVGDGAQIYSIAPDGVETVAVTPSGSTDPADTVTVGDGGVYTLPDESATVAVDGPGGLTEFDVAGSGG